MGSGYYGAPRMIFFFPNCIILNTHTWRGEWDMKKKGSFRPNSSFILILKPTPPRYDCLLSAISVGNRCRGKISPALPISYYHLRSPSMNSIISFPIMDLKTRTERSRIFAVWFPRLTEHNYFQC